MKSIRMISISASPETGCGIHKGPPISVSRDEAHALVMSGRAEYTDLRPESTAVMAPEEKAITTAPEIRRQGRPRK